MKNYIIKAALFDLDGVVAFTDKYHYLAWKKLADEQGWHFDETINNQLRGIPRMASLEVILQHNQVALPPAEKEHLATVKNNYYVELLKQINRDDLYEGIIEFLEQLRQRGIKTSICSSSKNADAVLEYLGITEYFDMVVTGNDITHAKPDPEVFLLGAKKLGVPPYHCIVFEDAYTGIQGAIAAGMKNCGVGNPETEELADEFIRKYSEIDVECLLESGKKEFFERSEYHIVEKPFRKNGIRHNESIFALGNGYMGLRGTYEEEIDGETPGMYINGVFETRKHQHPWFYKGHAKVEQYTANLTDWRLTTTWVDGEKVCFSQGTMLQHRRYLDMKEGSLKRELAWESTSGKRIRIETERIVDITRPHAAQISYRVTPLNFTGEITIESQVRMVNATNGRDFTEAVEQGNCNGTDFYALRTKNTGLQACCAVKNVISAESIQTEKQDTGNGDLYTFHIHAEEGKSVTLCKYAAFYATVDNVENMKQCAVTEAEQCAAQGFDALKSEQTAFWATHWCMGDIKIRGNDADDLAVRFNLFHCRQQIPTCNAMSVGATGLTGPQYSGKVFWDTEIYVMPYINYTDPAQTKEMLMFRYRTLDKARERAREMDGPGALFAWATIDGAETSTCLEASTAEYHLQSDIAYAIARYYRSTNDKDFLFRYGAEMLFDTAVFMYHLGKYIPYLDNKYCVNGVCGPDEYAGAVNNNCYTNHMLKFHFAFAEEIFGLMEREAPETLRKLCAKLNIFKSDVADWHQATANMYDGYNERYGIHEQDASFLYKDPVDLSKLPYHVSLLGSETNMLNVWRMQLVKQADVVLLMLLLGDQFTPEQKKANYAFYEPKTNHGSSLSPAVYSILANETGYEEDAYAYFKLAAYMDLCDVKHNTAGGLHLACLGGVWMTVANGFLGMRDYEDKLVFNPKLPNAWSGYEMDVCYRGRMIHIAVTAGDVRFTMTGGDPVTFECYGAVYTLENTLLIPRKTVE